MPVFGFNTDIKVGDKVFHVQTEDRGAGNPVIDTTVYVRGRVLAKRDTSYQDFLASPDFNESELHAMLEQQHKRVIEEVRSSALPELAQLEVKPSVGGVGVQLLNPATFLKGTTARLGLLVKKREGDEPIPGAAVRVWLHTGTPQPYEFSGETDSDGKVELEFHMPKLGPGGAQLQIQASAADGQDEIKYTLRPRPKT
jgi:hypothetical protein